MALMLEMLPVMLEFLMMSVMSLELVMVAVETKGVETDGEIRSGGLADHQCCDAYEHGKEQSTGTGYSFHINLRWPVISVYDRLWPSLFRHHC